MTTYTQAEIIKFLNGEEPLEGVFFGDPHPSGQAFWWRKYLLAVPNTNNELVDMAARLADSELRANQIEAQFNSQCQITAAALEELWLDAPSTSQVDIDVLIDELTHTAACYHDYSSLRQRIADVVSAHIKGGA